MWYEEEEEDAVLLFYLGHVYYAFHMLFNECIAFS